MSVRKLLLIVAGLAFLFALASQIHQYENRVILLSAVYLPLLGYAIIIRGYRLYFFIFCSLLYFALFLRLRLPELTIEAPAGRDHWLNAILIRQLEMLDPLPPGLDRRDYVDRGELKEHEATIASSLRLSHFLGLVIFAACGACLGRRVDRTRGTKRGP